MEQDAKLEEWNVNSITTIEDQLKEAKQKLANAKNKKSKRLIDAATVEREATARRAAKAKREPARRRRP